MGDNLSFYERFAPFYRDWYDKLHGARTVENWSAALAANNVRPRAGAKRMLDLACGPGTHIQAWQQAGWNVEGLDGSPSMLSLARERLGEDQTILYCADIRDEIALRPIRRRYDLVVAHFNFLNLFSDSEIETVLENACGLLRRGGCLATDTTTADFHSLSNLRVSNDAHEIVGHVRLDQDQRRVERIWNFAGVSLSESIYVHALDRLIEAARGANLSTLACVPVESNFGPLSEDHEIPMQHWLLQFHLS